MTEITVSPTGNAKVDEVFNADLGKITSLIFKSEEAIEVSDGHHTMEELYEHRHALFVALVKVMDSLITPLNPPYPKCWKSKLHDDATMYPGWFIMGITINHPNFTGPTVKQDITYHLPMKYWNKTPHITALPKAPPYDGYTSKDVIERLLAICQ